MSEKALTFLRFGYLLSYFYSFTHCHFLHFQVRLCPVGTLRLSFLVLFYVHCKKCKMFLESIEIFPSELSMIPENLSLSPETDRFKEFPKKKFLLLSIIFGNVCEVVFTRDKSFLDLVST